MTVEQGPVADPLINSITALDFSGQDVVAKYFPEYKRVKHQIRKHPESITGESFAMVFRYLKAYYDETKDRHCSSLVVKLLKHQQTLRAHDLEEVFIWAFGQQMDDIIEVILSKKRPFVNAFSLQTFEMLIDSVHLPRFIEYLLYMTTVESYDESIVTVFKELFYYTACHGSPDLIKVFLARCPFLNTPENKRMALERAIENGNTPMVIYFRSSNVLEPQRDYSVTLAILRNAQGDLLSALQQAPAGSSFCEKIIFRAAQSHLEHRLSLSDANIMLARVESTLALLANLSLLSVSARCQYYLDVESEIVLACKLVSKKIKEESNKESELLRNIETILAEDEWGSSRTSSLENEILTSQHEHYSPDEKVLIETNLPPRRNDSAVRLGSVAIKDVRAQFHPRKSPIVRKSPEISSTSTSTSSSPTPRYDEEPFDLAIESAIAQLSLGDEPMTSPYFSGFEEMAQLVMRRPDLVDESLFYMVFRYIKLYFDETRDERCTHYLVAVLNSGNQYKAVDLEYAFLWALKNEFCNVMQAILSQRLCFIRAFPLVAFKIMIHEHKLTDYLEGFLFSSLEAIDAKSITIIKELFIYAARKGDPDLLKMLLNHADFLRNHQQIDAALDAAVHDMNIPNILFLWKHHYVSFAKLTKKAQLNTVAPNVVSLLDLEDSIEKFNEKLVIRVGQMFALGCLTEKDLNAVLELFDAHVELMSGMAVLLPKEKEKHYITMGLSMINDAKQLSVKIRQIIPYHKFIASDTYLPLRNSLQSRLPSALLEEACSGDRARKPPPL